MPRQRHGRRHSVVSYNTGVKPPKPGVSRYWLIDFTLPTPGPARPYRLSAMTELLCAVGVVPTRVYPKSGRISALAGREGRLRACSQHFQPEDWQRWCCLVTTFIIKAMLFPPFGGGGGAFQLWGRGFVVSVLCETGVFPGSMFVYCN